MKTNYVLIDYENVKPESIELLDQEWIRVYLFVGKNQARIPLGLAKTMQCLGERAHYVTMSGVGPNALDFSHRLLHRSFVRYRPAGVLPHHFKGQGV